jgi:nicotinate phosphoribosyltransferase
MPEGSRSRPFHVASEDDIREGRTSDVYFYRALKVLERVGKERTVVTAEFTAGALPDGYDWAVLCGLEELLALMVGRRVDVEALPEGTIFPRKTHSGVPVPVATITGPYAEFGVYETPMLGLLCEASGVATKAARVRRAAGDRRLISFGIRRMHPAIAPMIDRACYVGGLDAVSSLIGADIIGESPVGTVPHALTVILGSPEGAFEALAGFEDADLPRIALVDTYYDEKVEATKAAAVIEGLQGVRLDTPSSRRGAFASIVREVRWELDIRGHEDVKIYLSGGIDERQIPELIAAGADGFGVGTSLANAPTVDYALDIVEIDGHPVAKRGKFGGRKRLLRCPQDGTFEVGVERCPSCGGTMEAATRTYLKDGKPTEALPTPKDIRAYVLDQLASLAGDPS